MQIIPWKTFAKQNLNTCLGYIGASDLLFQCWYIAVFLGNDEHWYKGLAWCISLASCTVSSQTLFWLLALALLALFGDAYAQVETNVLQEFQNKCAS